MVKIYGYNSVKHGMVFSQDMKLGQYMVCRSFVFFNLSSLLTIYRIENPPSSSLRWSILFNGPCYGNSNWRLVHLFFDELETYILS
jgi:hypothetical protein